MFSLRFEADLKLMLLELEMSCFKMSFEIIFTSKDSGVLRELEDKRHENANIIC